MIHRTQATLACSLPQNGHDIPINDVRVQIVLPPGVTASDVKTTQNFYNGTSTVEGQIGGLLGNSMFCKPNEQYIVGVSFPAKYHAQL